MKRGNKLLLLLAVLVVLVGATWLAGKLDPEVTEEEETAGTTIFTLDADSVTALGWDYSEAVSFTRTDAGWQYDADAAFSVEESYLDAMLETLSQVVSTKTIENVQDLDQYGLEVPVCTVTVTADTAYTLTIGDETALGGERYFSTGDGNVYLVDATVIDSFCYGLYDVLAYEELPTVTNVTSMAWDAEGEHYEIVYAENSGAAYSDSYVWFMDGQALDTELTQSLIARVTEVSWDSCVEFNAQDLSLYGLDTPAAAVTLSYETEVQLETGETDENGEAVYETQYVPGTFTLEIGDDTEDGCYAKLAGSHMVYLIASNVRDKLLYTTCSELLPDEVLLMDWAEVTAMDITLDGATYRFTCKVETVTDDAGETTEETVWYLNGEEVDGTGICECLDAIDSNGYATGLTPTLAEELRIVVYRDRERFSEVVLVLYRYDSSSCIATLDGTPTVLADRAAVVELIEAVNAVVLD